MFAPSILGTDPALVADLLTVPTSLEPAVAARDVAIALGAVGLVTGARVGLLAAWPDFKAATERSNKQVLEPLGWADIVAVAVLTGFSEEALFR